MKVCENCNIPAECYAIDPFPGDWGGYYCYEHVPKGFRITDWVKDRFLHDNQFIIRRLLSDAKDFTEKEIHNQTMTEGSVLHVRAIARLELLEYLKEQYLQGGNKNA